VDTSWTDRYQPDLYQQDMLQFEQWFNGEEFGNPRIELAKAIIDDLPEPHREVLEMTFYEGLTRREIMRRHGLTNVFYAQKLVERALAAFAQEWEAEHGVPEPSTHMRMDDQ